MKYFLLLDEILLAGEADTLEEIRLKRHFLFFLEWKKHPKPLKDRLSIVEIKDTKFLEDLSPRQDR